MRYGMPTLVELNNLEENMKLCKGLGLDFIELNMCFPEFTTEMNTEEILRLKQVYDLDLTLHVGEQIDCCLFDPILREAMLKHMARTFAIAEELGIKRINMHMAAGIHVTLPAEKVRLYERYKTTYIKNLEAFMSMAQVYSGIIMLENTGLLDMTFIQEGMLKLLESNQFQLTYDIGHDITSGYKDRDFYRVHDDRIVHYHIHDGTDQHNHLPLFTGDLDIESFLRAAEVKEAACVFEVKTVKDLEASIRQLKEKRII